jgi:hypothetical protein
MADTLDDQKITPGILEARQAAMRFLQEELQLPDPKLIALSKVEGGWEASAEVFEESAFIKALGLSTRTKDRNLYHLKLSSELTIVSYNREENNREESVSERPRRA